MVILDKAAPPQVRFIGQVPERLIEFDGERFFDAGLGDWVGFYDWMRPQARRVIGVQLFPDVNNVHLARLSLCVGVESHHKGKELRIFFGDEREFQPALSGDQDFGGNQLFVGQTRYVMTFNTPQPCSETLPLPKKVDLGKPASATGQALLWRLGCGLALLVSMLAFAAWTQ